MTIFVTRRVDHQPCAVAQTGQAPESLLWGGLIVLTEAFEENPASPSDLQRCEKGCTESIVV